MKMFFKYDIQVKDQNVLAGLVGYQERLWLSKLLVLLEMVIKEDPC